MTEDDLSAPGLLPVPPPAPDVADLAAEFPHWEFKTVWQSAGSGPDARNLLACQDGVLLADATAAGLREKIRREEGSC
jgi:hypothetical protein